MSLLVLQTSRLLYPFFLTFVGVLINALVIGFTGPFDSLVCLGTLPLIVVVAWMNVIICFNCIPNVFWTNSVVAHACSNVFRYVSLVLLRRWSYETPGTVASDGKPRVGFWGSLQFGLLTAVSTLGMWAHPMK